MPSFTDKHIKALKPKESKYLVRENIGDISQGFALKVSPSGVKSWMYIYKQAGRKIEITLGKYPYVSVAAARELYLEKRAIKESGGDPLGVVIQRDSNGTFQQMLDNYTDDLEARGKSSYEIKTAFKNHVLTHIRGGKLARQVTVDDLRLVLHHKLKSGAQRSAAKLWSFLHTAYIKAIHYDNDPINLDKPLRFGIESNLMQLIPKPAGANNPGQRWLKSHELKYVWDNFSGSAFGVALRLMVTMGGQRPVDVLSAQWGDIDEAARLYDPSRASKNETFNILPLNELSMQQLAALKLWTGGEDYLFPRHNGGRLKSAQSVEYMGLSSFSKAVKKFCDDPECEIEPFTPRDIRRTCKTLMGQAGIPKDMRDRLQNHALQDVSTRHYDRYDYINEKRQALDVWNDYLMQLLVPGADPAQ